jgi:predicted DNA-binding antitoxin AbrB/MazE fold protein
MSGIEAIYQDGVFKPLGQIVMRDHQRVRLEVRLVEDSNVAAWLDEVQNYQKLILSNRRPFPDSSSDIAADRGR